MSKKNLFSQSITDNAKNSFFIKIADYKMSSSGFVKSTEHLQTSIEFYDEEVKKSKKLHEAKFTNFLNRHRNTALQHRIQELFQNPAIVDNDKVNVVRLTTKVKSCIQLYVDSLESDPLVVKSELPTAFGQQVGVRVYSMFDLPDNDPANKPVFRIVLIDPFHLVIPSQFGRKSKEQMEEDTYRENQDNNLCMSDCLLSLR